jgi:hypothetical protein
VAPQASSYCAHASAFVTHDVLFSRLDCRLELQYAHEQGLLMIPLVRDCSCPSLPVSIFAFVVLSALGLCSSLVRMLIRTPFWAKMMEQGYKATGWLGLILGAKIWYPFYPAVVETDVAFMKQMDAVCRDLGERGKPKKPACRMSEGVPPASQSMELSPAPASAPAPAPALASIPTLTRALETAPVPAPAMPAANSFTPSMQLSSPSGAAMLQQRSTTDTTSLAEVLFEQQRLMLEREEKTEAKADKLWQEMRHQMDKMREKMQLAPPAEAISEERLTALQARIEAVHAAKLLSDDELYALEDMVADFVEFESSIGVVVTLEIVHGNESASKLLKLVALSERLVADSAFARQARRKYV